MRIPVSIRTNYYMADTDALVDSGATENFMHPTFAKRLGLGLRPLEQTKADLQHRQLLKQSGEYHPLP